jgi:FkbM family methyltransferase
MRRQPFLLRTVRLVRGLGARSGFRALYLLIRKELARDTVGNPRQMRVPDVPHPIWLRESTSDFEIMEQIFLRREYDFAAWSSHHAMIQRTYGELLNERKVPVIVDCGANIGYASIWFAIKYPQAIVYAIEPEPRNFAMLSRNVSTYPNIVPIQAGVSDRVTKVSLRNPTDEPWACQTEEDDQGSVETVTIPHLLDMRPNGVPLIVKVDIEGYETSLFRSNTGWAGRTPLVVFEMHDWLFHWRGTGHAMFRCLTQWPRDYLVRGENIFSFAHPEQSSVVTGQDDRIPADFRLERAASALAR